MNPSSLMYDLATAAEDHRKAAKSVDEWRKRETAQAERFDDLLERLRPALRNVPEMTVFNVGGVFLVWDGDTLNVGRQGYSHELTPLADARPPVAEAVADCDEAA